MKLAQWISSRVKVLKVLKGESVHRQFVEFVNAKPADEVIDHWSWKTCAVGQFAQSIGRSNINHSWIFQEVCGDSAMLEAVLEYGGRRLWVDRQFTYRPVVGHKPVIETYGDLQKFLNGEIDVLVG